MWDWGRSGGCRVAGPVGRVQGRVPGGSAGPVEAGGGAGVRDGGIARGPWGRTRRGTSYAGKCVGRTCRTYARLVRKRRVNGTRTSQVCGLTGPNGRAGRAMRVS